MTGISKRFPGVQALDSVDLELYEGEILGLIGENGAGKSTLMRILGGDYSPDAGTIYLNGKPISPKDVRESMSLGISIIYQELNLAPNLDIASNIFLGREPLKRLLGLVDRQRLYDEASEIAARVGISAPLTTPVEKLSPGERQLVEIAKALSVKSKVLVLDEPTSSLTLPEADKLFKVMHKLKEQEVSMIYISHRLAEVQEMCDRVIVLRDGRRVGELVRKVSVSPASSSSIPIEEGHGEVGISHSEMVKLMVGRDISRFFPGQTNRKSNREVIMSVRGFWYPGAKAEVSFDLYSGEILGIAGLVGAGRTELAISLFGIDLNGCMAGSKSHGEVFVCGEKVDIRSPADAIRCGIGLVPEDRKLLGVILEMAVSENITLPSIGSYRPPFLDRKRELQVASQMVEALDIKTPSLDQQVQFLSGGNQQKVAVAKWLCLNPRILILDEPTRGIDVGSKSEIYRLIRELADKGMGVIMISSELEEIIGLADRVLVMHEGRCTGILDHGEITEENIMHLATGGTTI